MTALRQLACLAASACVFLAAGPASASDTSDINTLVQKWVADLNRGDVKAVVAACAPGASVIDGFPPYAWATCADWMSAYDANNKRTDAAPGVVSIGEPVYTEVTGPDAYIIYPATFTNVQKGRTVGYRGTWTMTLHREAGGWIFTATASNWGGDYTIRSGG